MRGWGRDAEVLLLHFGVCGLVQRRVARAPNGRPCCPQPLLLAAVAVACAPTHLPRLVCVTSPPHYALVRGPPNHPQFFFTGAPWEIKARDYAAQVRRRHGQATWAGGMAPLGWGWGAAGSKASGRCSGAVAVGLCGVGS